MNSVAVPAEMLHPYIERRSEVQGGRPVIKGSRFPVSSIVQDYRRGLSVEEILCEFPQLTPAEVHDALSYYYDHQSEVEQDLAQMADLETAMRQYPPTLRPPDHGIR